MKSCLIVLLILLLVFVLLVGGAIFAVRPPFKVVTAPPADDAKLEAASYVEGRLEAALDDYDYKGDLVVSLDQVGLSQILAGALAQLPIPANIRPTGIFMDIKHSHIEIGGAFKILFIHVGVSGRFGVEMNEDNIELKLISSHLGRLPLPINYVANTVGKYADIPDDLASLSVSVPLDFQGESFDVIQLKDLSLQPGQILISIFIEEGLIPDISPEVLADFDKAFPRIEDAIKNNETATAKLQEIKKHLDAAKEGKKINPLTVKRLGEELYSSLSKEELEDLESILGSDDLINYLQNVD